MDTDVDFHFVNSEDFLLICGVPFVPLLPARCYLYEVKVAITEESCLPRIRLTKSVIDDLPVLPKDTLYWDAGLPGFGVKVTPKGRKVFLVMYRVAGAGSRLRKYTIGPYGRVTLPMARAQAQKIFAATARWPRPGGGEKAVSTPSGGRPHR